MSQNSQENSWAGVPFCKKVTNYFPATLLKKEALAYMVSCEFCHILKNTIFAEHLRGIASALDYRITAKSTIYEKKQDFSGFCIVKERLARNICFKNIKSTHFRKIIKDSL